ncbi:hypothetical protein BD410DRAFT_37359 [Rickenella mellea]|uniref:Uncharacterized protein n=1 Tax=Rickenella mellea TaxID=50990 RepID=A0A4R5XF01_9AGAM|nr:hypothetical protein BD410DRAFT_37359 [Rickenella mellea]
MFNFQCRIPSPAPRLPLPCLPKAADYPRSSAPWHPSQMNLPNTEAVNYALFLWLFLGLVAYLCTFDVMRMASIADTSSGIGKHAHQQFCCTKLLSVGPTLARSCTDTAPATMSWTKLGTKLYYPSEVELVAELDEW